MQPVSNRAREHFEQARKEAALQDILAGLRRKSADLLSFDEIRSGFTAESRAEDETRLIPLEAVIGSVGRYNDFNHDFLPRNKSDVDRWTSVMAAREANVDLPPIQVYRLGEVYFVIDGNHRVSVARRRGETEIRAWVTEIPSRVGLTAQDSVEDIVRKAALNSFLEQTELDDHPDQPDFHAAPGAYPALLQQIEAVRFAGSRDAQEQAPLPAAARTWYEDHYRPIVEIIRSRNLLRHYPNRSETDLYIWLLENRQALADEFGWGVRLEAVAADLAGRVRTGGRLRRMLRTAADPEQGTGEWRARRLAQTEGRMFSDVLLVIDRDDPTGPAFHQALRIADEESAHLLGLWIDEDLAAGSPGYAERKREYESHWEAVGVFGQFAVGRGDRSDLVRARARWADLLVLQSSTGRAPSRALQQTLAGVFIPVWVARGRPDPLPHVLLAYDGSRKADEALFLVAYLGALWGYEISVLTVDEPGVSAGIIEHARTYLESFKIEARCLSGKPPVPDAILAAVEETGAGLLATGSVHTGRLVRAALGPTLDRLLTDSPIPLLICR